MTHNPFKDICSNADDVTIVGGMGSVEEGWAIVEKRYEWAASRVSTDNSEPQSEIFSLVASSELQQLALKVTTVFRREGDNGRSRIVTLIR